MVNRIAKGLILVVVIIFGVIMSYLLIRNLFFTSPVFTIISHNGNSEISYDADFNPIWSYTVYVKIKNVDGDGSRKVCCEITRYDLTICTTSRTISLKSNEEKVISFFFSHQNLKGDSPIQYKVWLE